MYFNPRSDERSDPPEAYFVGEYSISIHAPTNGATIRNHCYHPKILFQSTLRRTERPEQVQQSIDSSTISIHAPTNGATLLWQLHAAVLLISIHAPTNGATYESIHRTPPISFQSTLRRTERLKPFLYCADVFLFQSTLRRTERLKYINIHINITIFQSTLRRTERQSTYTFYQQNIQFQSTLRRTERQHQHAEVYTHRQISIHAPTNGATVLACVKGYSDKNFNPRSDERSDSPETIKMAIIGHFNPRSDERSDGAGSAVYRFQYNFNPRSDERSDVRRT